ncbi:MAG: esterase-like activity of phytase family protein [Solirubrobacteraceae bacterium]|nr:esterase-like activity of phytase family protein [Solirubrobacteraceae bacterium]
MKLQLWPQRPTAAAFLIAALASAGAAESASATPSWFPWQKAESFGHVGTFSVPQNLPAGAPANAVTSAEILDATADGRTLVYSDSPQQQIGFVDASNPRAPQPGGVLPVGGEPTSVATAGQWSLVGVNTSASFVEPKGELLVVNPTTRQIAARITLAGQPDSIAVSPDGRYAAIVIENERDEDVLGGLIPQAPAGVLQILDLKGPVWKWDRQLRTVDLTGIAQTAPSDPEPEFVDINRRNEAVVSLQENNHLAIVDLKKAKVTRHFSAGSVDLKNVDATEEEVGPQGSGLIELDDDLPARRREPDAVHWVDDDTFATANEGDYEDENGVEGGSRGFTLFNSRGYVEFESGASFEHEVVRAGHFPEARAENKGAEPEGLEVATFGRTTYLFVGAERANVVGVYEITRGAPKFVGLLPTGVGPEGIRAIPRRGLLAVSAETDTPGAVRSVVTLYDLKRRSVAPYPQLVSANDAAGLPIPWVAQSGLSGDPVEKNTLWSVSDSYLGQSWIYKIDTARTPAVITQRIPVGAAETDDQLLGEFDLEGVVARKEGGFWLASEGRTNVGSSRPNLIVRTDAAGTVLQSIPLPASLATKANSSGFEGVTVTGTQAAGNETVWVVVQREWADDAKGVVKIGRYDVAAGTWTFALYPLDAVESPAGGFVGLSEITLLPDGKSVAIVERDNQLAENARIKRIYGVDLTDPSVSWKAHGEPLATVSKRLLRDAISELDAKSISVPDKLEGVGITKAGKVFLSTDNDGVDGNFGESLLFQTAPLR